MKQIIYEDCNNNSLFLKRLFERIQELSDEDINWKVSNLEFIPVYKGDFYNGVPSREMEVIYNFRKKAIENYTFYINNSFFMGLLDNIKTIYEGLFIGDVRGEQIKIKIFDGDIIEVEGSAESMIEI